MFKNRGFARDYCIGTPLCAEYTVLRVQMAPSGEVRILDPLVKRILVHFGYYCRRWPGWAGCLA
jgi:hypothetical protein